MEREHTIDTISPFSESNRYPVNPREMVSYHIDSQQQSGKKSLEPKSGNKKSKTKRIENHFFGTTMAY